MIPDNDKSDGDKSDTEYINWIVSQSVPKAFRLQEIKEASTVDASIQAVKKALDDNDWTTRECAPYKSFVTEFCLADEILLRNTKIVMPKELQERCMELAHEGHPGMSVMKRRLRSKVWWPKMDDDVEKFVKKCKGCTLVGAPSSPEPMTRTQLSTAPWEHLAIDFCGPLPSGHYLLVVVDYYSRYKEVDIMRNTDTAETLKRLTRIFARFGMPISVRADNGPQFKSKEFENYCIDHAIHLNKGTPHWPQQNGEVERQNRSLKKRLQISQLEKRDWIQDMEQYLLMYRSTPHSITGKSPAEMMFNRTIRDKLPAMPAISMPDEEVIDRDREAKSKGMEYANEKRNAKPSDIKEGDDVIIKRPKKANKLSSTFEPTVYKVVKRNGSEITVMNEETSTQYRRNVAHAKKVEMQTGKTDVETQTTGNRAKQQQNINVNEETIADEHSTLGEEKESHFDEEMDEEDINKQTEESETKEQNGGMKHDDQRSATLRRVQEQGVPSEKRKRSAPKWLSDYSVQTNKRKE